MNGIPTGTAVKSRAEIGKLGGLACLAKHGKEHYREIGKKGYQTTLARYFQGDAIAYRRWLIARGWNVLADALAGYEIERRLTAGQDIVCIELPYLDEDSEFDRRADESEFMDRYE